MMCEKVAKRLNALTECANDKITCTTREDGMIIFVSLNSGPDTAPAVKAACLAAIEAEMPRAVHDEIAIAAAEKRRASVAAIKDGYSWDQSRAQILACERAQVAIAAILAADQAARTADYEAYRVYCEQGLALAPLE